MNNGVIEKLVDLYQDGAARAFKLHCQDKGIDARQYSAAAADLICRFIKARFETEIWNPCQDAPGLAYQVINTECNYVAMLVLMALNLIPRTSAYTTAIQSVPGMEG